MAHGERHDKIKGTPYPVASNPWNALQEVQFRYTARQLVASVFSASKGAFRRAQRALTLKQNRLIPIPDSASLASNRSREANTPKASAHLLDVEDSRATGLSNSLTDESDIDFIAFQDNTLDPQKFPESLAKATFNRLDHSQKELLKRYNSDGISCSFGVGASKQISVNESNEKCLLTLDPSENDFTLRRSFDTLVKMIDAWKNNGFSRLGSPLKMQDRNTGVSQFYNLKIDAPKSIKPSKDDPKNKFIFRAKSIPGEIEIDIGNTDDLFKREFHDRFYALQERGTPLTIDNTAGQCKVGNYTQEITMREISNTLNPFLLQLKERKTPLDIVPEMSGVVDEDAKSVTSFKLSDALTSPLPLSTIKKESETNTGLLSSLVVFETLPSGLSSTRERLAEPQPSGEQSTSHKRSLEILNQAKAPVTPSAGYTRSEQVEMRQDAGALITQLQLHGVNVPTDTSVRTRSRQSNMERRQILESPER